MQDLRQIFPASGRHITPAVYGSFYSVKIILFQLQEIQDCPVKPLLSGIFLPCLIIRLHLQYLEPVHGNHVKLPHRFVILRRVSRRHNHPPFGHTVTAKYLVLQKLKHGRGKGFRHTVDLIQKQNSLPDTALFHHLVNGSNDLAHGIFGHIIGHALIFPVGNKGKPQGRLSGMMGHGIRNQRNPQLLSHLLHNRRLTDSRRPQQKNRPLADHRNPVLSELILL